MLSLCSMRLGDDMLLQRKGLLYMCMTTTQTSSTVKKNHTSSCQLPSTGKPHEMQYTTITLVPHAARQIKFGRRLQTCQSTLVPFLQQCKARRVSSLSIRLASGLCLRAFSIVHCRLLLLVFPPTQRLVSPE